jgi:hypothetical protein
LRFSVLAVCLLSSGCFSSWSVVSDIDTGCTIAPYYLDVDGDRWGDPSVPPELACEGNDGSGFTARNGRDCDDADFDITGLVGSICPERLVTDDTPHVGVQHGSSEYAVVVDDPVAAEVSELRWAQYGADACSARGWGGGLATFESSEELSAVKNSVESAVYAGWVGLVPDGSGGWSWEGGAAVDPAVVQYCSADAANSSDVESSDRLALIKRTDTSWCFGSPEEISAGGAALPSAAPGYEFRAAHFICERARPEPADFDVDLDDALLDSDAALGD